MAQTFDNRNFTSGEQQICYPIVSSSLRPNEANNVKDISSLRQPSTAIDHSLLSHEEKTFNKRLDNKPNSSSPFQSSLTSKNSIYQHQEQSFTTDYLPFSSQKPCSDRKLPPSNRIQRLASTTNNSYFQRSNAFPQNLQDGMKINTTYLNTTQLYINPPVVKNDSVLSPPPPPPPRCPIHPPAIPPRNMSTNHQKSYITIPDFNSSASPKVAYRSPVTSTVVKRNDLSGNDFLESQLKSFSFDNNHNVQQAPNELSTSEYFGECCKCGERITTVDDACDILGQIYHSFCAVCVLCGRSVKNRHFFLQDQLYCEEDFLYTGFHETLEYCVACDHLITDTILQALGKSYHLACFKCSKCSICLDGLPFLKDEKQNLFCLHDYHMTHAPRCNKCLNPICPDDGSNETVRIISMGKTFHVQCYQCEDCEMQLGNEQEHRCYPLGDALLCQECCHQRLICQNKF